MEIHATVQLVDYSETNLSAKLASIHEQIAHVVAPPVAATYNSGVELEAVVQATENAANQIMEAAEAIAQLAAGGRRSRRAAGGDPAGQRDLRGLHLPGPHRPADSPRDRAPAAGRDHAVGHDARRAGRAARSPVAPAVLTSCRPTSTTCSREPSPAISVISLLAHGGGELLVAVHRDHECARAADHVLPVVVVQVRLQRQDRQAVDR